MKCSIKNCKSYSRLGCNVHFFGFPLYDENRLDKWIAVVRIGKPNWKPKKSSRICSLHFNESDIIKGMGYQRFNLHKNAVPKDYSSIVVEKEQIDITKSKDINNDINISKPVSCNKTRVLDKRTWNHNLKNNVSTMIENDESYIFDTEDPNQSFQNTISQANKKHVFTQTDSKEINATNISRSETYILDESAAWDHNYSKNNVTTMIENDVSNTFNIRNSNQSVQKTIFHPNPKFIQINSKDVTTRISRNLNNFNYKKIKINFKNEINFATKKINELSKNLTNMEVKNKTLQQKLRRYNERVTLIKELFDRLQQEKLISGHLQLIRKQLERLTSQNKCKNESQLNMKEIEEN